MLFTGSELTLKRNFYTQTGYYGFVMSATVDTTTGAYHFGLSGNGGTIDFRLESGRIYYDSEFIHSYKPFEQFTIEAQFSSGHTNVLKNDSPLLYGHPKLTGYYDYFYFTRASANMGGELDVEISGNNAAVYSITQQGYLFSSGQNAVTGWFTNQGSSTIRVFDSEEQSSAIYEFGKIVGNIAAGGSGAFAYTGDYNVLDFSQPILTTFATNYGDTEILFSIIDARSFDYFIQITGPTDFGFNSDNILNRDVSYLNFSGGLVTNDFDTRLTFLLSYVSGSGSFVPATGSPYIKTFTGSWQFATGTGALALINFVPISATLYSGSGIFPANSYVNMQVTYNASGETPDGAYLIVTGDGVIDVISQSLSLP
jgi:hypothetical protein